MKPHAKALPENEKRSGRGPDLLNGSGVPPSPEP